MTANIQTFLIDRSHISVSVENLSEDFESFWRRIGAAGDLTAAKAELQVRHNATD